MDVEETKITEILRFSHLKDSIEWNWNEEKQCVVLSVVLYSTTTPSFTTVSIPLKDWITATSFIDRKRDQNGGTEI